MKNLIIVTRTASDDTREALREAVRKHSTPATGISEIHEIQAGEDIVAVVERRLRDAFDCVVAVGGDGTVAAVAHVLVGSDIPLGIVPAGTGNMVARELEIPLDVGAAIALIAGQHRLRKIDAMMITGHTYLLNAGVGINAEVIDRTSRVGKTLFGRSAYIGTAIWEVIRAKAKRLEITIDGDTATYKATDVLISNCGMLARGLHPNSVAIHADDGQVHVCITCAKSPLAYPWHYIRKSLFPRRANRIIHERVASQSVTVRSRVPLSVQADGDIIGTTPIQVDVHPQAISVIVPCD